ncbi:hypothetical protein DFH07DRAFT_948354 [Mycena maculata]|uniref:Uncharacterized protein n=1 Tax=Mycena maculata TaxID=230809 RepID=A0AAD7P253_9AGAR|nr:hypothetical protein DFH07DRAFT_948354 [Mycena maculata]
MPVPVPIRPHPSPLAPWTAALADDDAEDGAVTDDTLRRSRSSLNARKLLPRVTSPSHASRGRRTHRIRLCSNAPAPAPITVTAAGPLSLDDDDRREQAFQSLRMMRRRCTCAAAASRCSPQPLPFNAFLQVFNTSP